MFWRSFVDPVQIARPAHRAVHGAAGLFRAFMLLEDPVLDGGFEGHHELTGGSAPHPHRTPLRPRRGQRRPGATLPRPQHCVSPVVVVAHRRRGPAQRATVTR
jgi:hypothetical protein